MSIEADPQWIERERKGRCQAHLGTLSGGQCPAIGDRYEVGGDGTTLLFTYACTDHVEVLLHSIRQWRKSNLTP
jgi:hypothetical protein